MKPMKHLFEVFLSVRIFLSGVVNGADFSTKLRVIVYVLSAVGEDETYIYKNYNFREIFQYM